MDHVVLWCADPLRSIRGSERFQVDGLVVDVWNEKGLVMVLARPA